MSNGDDLIRSLRLLSTKTVDRIKRNRGTIFFLALLLAFLLYQKVPVYLEEKRAENRPLPPFMLQTLTGEQIENSSVAGKKMILNFWATWCPPCRVEIPILNSLYPNVKRDDFIFIAVSSEDSDIVRQFVKKENIVYPVAVDVEGTATDSFRILAYPTFVFINEKGSIDSMQSGFDPLIRWKIRKFATGSYF